MAGTVHRPALVASSRRFCNCAVLLPPSYVPATLYHNFGQFLEPSTSLHRGIRITSRISLRQEPAMGKSHFSIWRLQLDGTDSALRTLVSFLLLPHTTIEPFPTSRSTPLRLACSLPSSASRLLQLCVSRTQSEPIAVRYGLGDTRFCATQGCAGQCIRWEYRLRASRPPGCTRLPAYTTSFAARAACCTRRCALS